MLVWEDVYDEDEKREHQQREGAGMTWVVLEQALFAQMMGF